MEDPTQNNVPPSPTPSRLSLVSTTRVENIWPDESIPVPYRLAIIGEAPGAEEEQSGIPFYGQSGKLLDSILSAVGILRTACYIGNVCKYRPPGNDITEFDSYFEKTIKGQVKFLRRKGSYMEDPRVVEGMNELRADLERFRPNCTILLGNTPLRFACGPGKSISDWQCSIIATSIGKAIPAYHPAYVLRQYKEKPYLTTALRRARTEAESPDIVLPNRQFDLDLSALEICSRLDNWPTDQKCSVDIEGGLDGWICISVSDTPLHAFIVAFSQFSSNEQGLIYQSLSRLLFRPDVPKVLQNGLYDAFVLYYGFNMLVCNIAEDTMLKSRAIYSELPAGLDSQAALWTRQPQWKHLIAYSIKEQRARAIAGVDPVQDLRNKWTACCIDSSVTLEISQAQDSALAANPACYGHYRFLIDLVPVFLYMERRGFNYDSTTAQIELAKCNAARQECYSRLEVRAGYSLLGKDSISETKLKQLLYNEKGYPVQYNGSGPDKKVTTDIGALLKLGQKNPNDPLILDLLLGSKLQSTAKTLSITCDPDGRVRAAYNPAGSETMRTTCYESPTGSGMNLQTVTKKLRKLETADSPNHWIAQCDLAGADGWTVASWAAFFDDPTMLDDYLFGLKPARIIALMRMHGVEYTFCKRAELKERCKEVDDDGWLYFACKRVQHASSYGVQAKTGCEQIMEDSYKMQGTPIFVTKDEFETLQHYFFVRYPGILRWHTYGKNQVYNGKNITASSGHTRVLFGRRRSWDYKTRTVAADHETWKEYLADEPQQNTTHANNTAALRLWNDPENRVVVPGRRGQSFRVEPLHQVHDALVVQFRKTDLDFAQRKLRLWYNVPLQIAGRTIVIPFDGTYGPSWGEQGVKYGGGKI